MSLNIKEVSISIQSPSTFKPPQLLKWIGSKQRFAEQIVSYMPQRINTYIEPFLGSASVLGTLASMNNGSIFPVYKKAIGSDILPYLIEIFNYVKTNPYALINHYERCITGYNEGREKRYYEIRNRFNQTFNGLDFAVLTRTCYSGVVRFRKSDGYMSTPIGPHTPISPKSFEERVLTWHKIIQDVEFLNMDFRDVMSLAKAGDLVYCDPPYTHSQTILYGSQEFSINDLWEKIFECKQKGAKVILSINGKSKSKTKDISVRAPEGLFERGIYVNCGISMINRLQKVGEVMENEDVHDKLLFTW